jgi:inosose dehydratase
LDYFTVLIGQNNFLSYLFTMTHRRNFLKTAACSLTAAALYPSFASGATKSMQGGQTHSNALPVGVAGYSFLHLDIDRSIALMQRLGLDCLSLKDFHLPLDSSPEKITEVMGKFRSAAITVYALGVIYMKTNAEVDRAFEYARKAGVGLIIGVPEIELLGYAEQKVKELGIRLAIHNHGPEDKLYPGPKEVYDRIRNMDARIGLCLDIGHATRSGADPARAVLDYAPRIFDLHIKDVAGRDKNAAAIEVGRGVIDFPALVRALLRIKYTGKCSIEFEKDMQDPLAGMAESTGYFKGVRDASLTIY